LAAFDVDEDKFNILLPKARRSLKVTAARLPEVTDPDEWPKLFHTYDELADTKAMSWVIRQIAQEQEITIVGGLAKHGKTWFLLSVVKALLSGEPLFGHFPVEQTSHRVLYLIPEVGLQPFKRRLVLMRLMEYVRTERLFVRTLSKGQTIALTDPRILKAAEGADVFLDTAVRFIEGDEQLSTDVKNSLSKNCMGLIAAGARSLWAAHHSPKAQRESDHMTLENMLRGSGDIGAMLSNAYGVRQLNEERNLVHVECLCGRDLDDTIEPFQVEGRPHVNQTGNFKMVAKPGEAGELSEYVATKENRGRRSSDRKEEKVAFAMNMKNAGSVTVEKITEALNKQFGSGHGKETIRTWIKDKETEMSLDGHPAPKDLPMDKPVGVN
jgi:hypothetical protein